MADYYLSPHVYACVTEDHGVLLDLQRDKYVGVAGAQLRALAASVSGWSELAAAGKSDGDAGRPAVTRAGTAAPTQPHAALLDKLLAADLITARAEGGKTASRPAVEVPESALVQEDLEVPPRVGIGHVVRFLCAAARAGWMLRRMPIARVIATVRARKESAAGASGGTGVPSARDVRGTNGDLRRTRELVAAYIHLRPLVYRVYEACLFDSLAVVEFLAFYGIYPTWIFGVQTAPFLAHCWVQEGSVTFNDHPERVRRFTPILAV